MVKRGKFEAEEMYDFRVSNIGFIYFGSVKSSVNRINAKIQLMIFFKVFVCSFYLSKIVCLYMEQEAGNFTQRLWLCRPMSFSTTLT